jgi:hypothetical protein
MTGRTRFHLLCLPAVLLCVINFAISPDVSAKPKKDVGPGNGKALGKLKKTKENSPPSLSVTPVVVVLENSFYEFVPSASDPDGDTLTFAINNRPGWADFDPNTGALYGTPGAADVGRYSAIQIAVSDGLSTAELSAFDIEVTSTTLASVTLQWQPPTENTDGTPLTDLAGYRIYYGVDRANLSDLIELPNPGLTTYVIEELTPNTWYFAMTSVNERGQESDLSNQLIGDTR